MLKPAQLYMGELNKKFIDIWYNPDYMYYSFSPGFGTLEFSKDNLYNHAFASIDKNNDVIGLISYELHWSTMSAYNMAIMAFNKFNIEFGRDLYEIINDIFFKYNMNRLSFQSVLDNPATTSYMRFINRLGGCICGHEHECIKLQDGKLHDMITFELLAKDFKQNFKRR